MIKLSSLYNLLWESSSYSQKQDSQMVHMVHDSPRYHFVSHAERDVSDTEVWPNGPEFRPKVQAAQAEFCPPCTGLPVSLKLSLCLALVSIIDGAIGVLSEKFCSAHFNRLKMWSSLFLKVHSQAMSLFWWQGMKHVRWNFQHLKCLICTKILS